MTDQEKLALLTAKLGVTLKPSDARYDKQGHLIQLRLAELNLIELPPEIGQFNYLEGLFLWDNRLYHLPPEIWQLTNLKRLDLDNNKLTTIPPEIGQLTNLEILGLFNNQLTNIPPEIWQLSKLKSVSLQENPFDTKLKSLTIRNFKAFPTCTLDLAPLTIFIGENSAGKSSLLQVLLLMKQTLESPSSKGVLTLNSHYVQFQQIREIIFGLPKEDATFGFEFGFANFKIRFVFKVFSQQHRVILHEFYINEQQLNVTNLTELNEMLVSDSDTKRFCSSEFYNFFETLNYVRPIRPAPQRYYRLSGVEPQWIGTEAEDLADYLEANPTVKKRVRDWFVKSAKLAKNVKFKSMPKRGQMEITFIEPHTGLEIDLSRLGFGYSQMLPLVVATFSEMRTLIFEAPEIHLNSSLHGLLTDLFIDGANSGKQILVETHSEHVIYRIQRRVAEGKIAPQDVAIYYISRGQAGSTAKRLTITPTGEIPDWPEGFFEAEMEDIYERVLARVKD